MERVSEIMTKKVIKVNADDTIIKAVSVMEKHNIKEVPVISKGNVLGIIRLYDLLELQKISSEEKVKNHIVSAPSINEDDKTTRAIEIMVKSGWEFLSVFNSKNALAGVLSDYDVLKISKNSFKGLYVKEFMQEIKAMGSNESVARAKKYMERNRIDRVPVQENGVYVGQIIWADLMRATSMLTKKQYGSMVGENIDSNKIPVKNLLKFRESVLENEPVEKAIDIMLNEQLRGLPVLNMNSEVVGIILRRDIIRRLLPEDNGIPIQFSGKELDETKKLEIIKSLSESIKKYENVEKLKVHAKKLKGTRYEVYLKAKSGNNYYNIKKSGKMMQALDECIHDLKVLLKGK